MGKLGAETIVGFKIQSGFDWGASATANSKLELTNFTGLENTTKLFRNPIGSGIVMQKTVDAGSTAPTISGEKEVLCDDAGIAMMAGFFGGCSAASLGSGAYKHTFTFNPTRKYYTFVHDEASGLLKEYINCVPTSLDFTAEPNTYMRESFNLLSTAMRLSSQSNSAAGLATATLPNEKVFVVRPDDAFRINAQAGGALSSTDTVSATSITINFAIPMEIVPEIKGSVGNGAPRFSGNPPFSATITMNLKTLENQTWFNAIQAGTEYKADFTVTGDTIGGGFSYAMVMSFPRLKIVSDPQYALTDPGENPETVTFEALVATANPTGMTSTYPYVEVTNTRTTSYFT